MTRGNSNSNLSGKTCFVGIGAQKSGTGWLGNYLSEHPEVCFSPIKELHYFDWRFFPENCGGFHKVICQRLRKVEERMAKSGGQADQILANLLKKRLEMADRPDAYLEFFEQLIRPQHLSYGEITPSYSMMPSTGFASMKRMLPNPKIIWLLRNPADRYWSQLRFTMKRKDGFDAEEQFIGMLDDSQFVLRTDYARTLTNLFSEFTRDEVQVVFYENLFFDECRDAEIRKITDFIGVSYKSANFENHINVSTEASLDPSLRLKAVRRFAHVYRAIEEEFGSLPKSWQEDIKLLERNS